MSYREQIRAALDTDQKKRRTTWETMLRHSHAYARALQLSNDELGQLEDMQGNAGMLPTQEDHARHSFLQLYVDGIRYYLYVKRVCGSFYGDEWRSCIMAYSSSRDNINQTYGYGTTLINHVSEDEHRKLVFKLAN